MRGESTCILRSTPDHLGPILDNSDAIGAIRVDAAGEGLYTALHRDSIDDVIRDVKEQRASAVLYR